MEGLEAALDVVAGKDGASPTVQQTSDNGETEATNPTATSRLGSSMHNNSKEDNTGLAANSSNQGTSNNPDPCNLGKQALTFAQNYGWIAQEYIRQPLLCSGRKFDLRCFVLLTNSTKDGFKAYWFRDGYVRLSCKKYRLDNFNDREVHLTNDAVQKQSKSYDKADSKLSYEAWQESINKEYPDVPENVVEAVIIPKIKEQAKDSILAALEKGLAQTKINRTFELLGYDFMIDSNFKPVLIEVNTNPCLEFVCPMLETIITSLIDNVWKVVVDDWFPPPSGTPFPPLSLFNIYIYIY